MNEQLIYSHMSFAERLAKKKKKSVGKNIYYEELESAAYCGLVDAANRYHSSKGHFEAFAAPRIFGEMGDYLRELQCQRKGLVFATPNKDADLEHLVSHEQIETKQIAQEILCKLPSRIRRIFQWYYYDDVTMKDIGDRLGVSESTVSLLIKKYVSFLQKRKEEILDNAG